MKPRPTETFLAMLRAAHARKIWYTYHRQGAMALYRKARRVWRALKKRDIKRKKNTEN